jgi:hypothetical protein
MVRADPAICGAGNGSDVAAFWDGEGCRDWVRSATPVAACGSHFAAGDIDEEGCPEARAVLAVFGRVFTSGDCERCAERKGEAALEHDVVLGDPERGRVDLRAGWIVWVAFKLCYFGAKVLRLATWTGVAYVTARALTVRRCAAGEDRETEPCS